MPPITSRGKPYETGVYGILNALDDKIYVGSASVSIKGRWGQHRRVLERGKHHSPHLQRAWIKYGPDNFTFVVLEVCSPDKCIEKEQYWIDKFQAANKEYGYNLSPTAGSPLGVKHTEETRKKVSAALIGKKKSEQHRQNIIAGKVNTKLSTRKKMGAYARQRSVSHKIKLALAMLGNTNGRKKRGTS